MITLACSTTTVHVNKLYLTENESRNVKIALEKQGFAVEFNELSYPSDIYSTSILYSPFVQDAKALETLEDILISLNYDIGSINALVTSNHWYTKNTIGLFLVPDGVAPHSGKNIEDISFLYQAESCETRAQLNLHNDGKFTYMTPEKTEISGTWSITQYPYIRLENDRPYLNFYYEITRSKRVDRIGEIEIIELHPLSSTLIISKCNMIYGIRV